MKIVVTGAQGNLGSALRAKSSLDITAIGRKEWSHLSTLCQGKDVVLHLASDLKTRVHEKPVNLFQSNLMTTAELLEVARENKVKKFVFVSSCAVYGMDQNTFEREHVCPVSLNGQTKLLNEELVRSFCQKNNMEYLILRLFNTFGGEDQFSVVSHLEKAIAGKSKFTLQNEGKGHRDFIHVEDIATCIHKLLENWPAEKIINIGTGQATSIAAIFKLALEKYPDLPYVKSDADECSFSQADTSILSKYIDHEFTTILDYLKKRWN